MATLYTQDILRSAIILADFPLLDMPMLRVEQRAKPCGSQIILDMNIDVHNTVNAIGMHVTACAFGQASAAVLAQSVLGKNREQLEQAHAALVLWLRDPAAPAPDWPRIEQLEPARAHPARHSAIALPFAAAIDALSQTASAGRVSA